MIHFTLFDQGGLFALAQVLMIDVVLAGDNAVVIGLAAARVPPHLRRKVIVFGLAAAVLLRVVMAFVAVQLMQIIGLTLAGGILLLWVSWRFWRDISGSHAKDHAEIDPNASLRRGDAIEEITDERAAELLADRRARGPAKKAAKKAPAKKAAAKKTAAKKAPAKKAAAAKR